MAGFVSRRKGSCLSDIYFEIFNASRLLNIKRMCLIEKIQIHKN